MAEAIKEQLEAMMRTTAQLRGLEPVVAERDGLDLEDVTQAVANLLTTYRTARPHLIALWLAIVTLAGALGLDWFSPPQVAPEQITQAVKSYVESVPLMPVAPPAGVEVYPFASAPAAQSGDPADVSIVGPATALPGDLIVLEAAGTFDSAKWFLGNSSKTFLPVDGGKRVVFASGAAGEYRFFVVAATVDGGKVSLDDATHVVTIGGPNPTPTPPSPTPPSPVPPAPAPTPVVPDDTFGNVGRLAFDTASKFSPAAKAKAAATGALYCEASARLAGDGDPARLFVNVSAAMAWLKQERAATWGDTAGEWQRFVDALSAPWNERWPMDKATAAEFLDCVGKALKQVQP